MVGAPSLLLPPTNLPTFASKLLWIYYFKLHRENMDLLLPQCKKHEEPHRELSHQQ